MPCTYYETPEEINARRNDRVAKYKESLDKLTHENDMLREALLAIYAKFPSVVERYVDKGTVELLDKEQIDHRKRDLRRLEKTFRETKDAKRLGLVMLADPRQPLKEQLGFDPDEF